jgi:hypothetical protein
LKLVGNWEDAVQSALQKPPPKPPKPENKNGPQ